MRRTSWSSTKSLVLLFCMAAGLFFDLLIPPFQNPDEPEHFGLILTYSLGSEKKADIEKEIIKLMDTHAWWRFIGRGRPPVLPESFMKMDFLVFRDFREHVGRTAVYHYLLGKIQHAFFQARIAPSYYFCRLISVMLMIATLFLVYLSLERISGLTRPVFLASFFSILFLPQFLTISVSVNPDCLSFFLSAVFFFASLSLITRGPQIGYLALLFLATGLSFFTDRSVFFLVILFLLSPFFWVRKENLKHDLGLGLIFFLAFITAASWVAWYTPAQVYDILAGLQPFALNQLPAAAKLLTMTPFNKSFWLSLADSSLLKFGWMAFPADDIFYYLWRTFVLLSVLGILISLGRYGYLRAKGLNSPLSGPLRPRLVLFSMIAVIFQVWAVWVPCLANGILPQGRYLYPSMIPLALLFWLGIDNFFSIFHRAAGRVVVCVLVIGEFFFLSYAVWNDILPVFHLTVKAPHPGI